MPPPRSLIRSSGRSRGSPVTAHPDPEGAHVVSTRGLVKRLTRGKQLLVEQNFAEGARLLQAILESDEDAFFFPDQENKSVERSLKLEAQTLLGQMPAEGREIYEKQYGPAARRLFEDALRLNDIDGRGRSSPARFFHTQSLGYYEAAYRLAADHLDHERALTAALCFERLRAVRRLRSLWPIRAVSVTQDRPWRLAAGRMERYGDGRNPGRDEGADDNASPPS